MLPAAALRWPAAPPILGFVPRGRRNLELASEAQAAEVDLQATNVELQAAKVGPEAVKVGLQVSEEELQAVQWELQAAEVELHDAQWELQAAGARGFELPAVLHAFLLWDVTRSLRHCRLQDRGFVAALVVDAAAAVPQVRDLLFALEARGPVDALEAHADGVLSRFLVVLRAHLKVVVLLALLAAVALLPLLCCAAAVLGVAFVAAAALQLRSVTAALLVVVALQSRLRAILQVRFLATV